MERIMKNMITVEYGIKPCNILLQALTTNGNGIVCLITGGVLPHLGGVALASPRPSTGENPHITCDEWIVTVPGHKDTVLAQKIAKMISTKTNEAVSVNMGIHLDHITPEQFSLIQANCCSAAELFLKEYELNESMDDHD